MDMRYVFIRNNNQILLSNEVRFFFLKAFAQLLRAPHDEAQIIIRERFPVPRLVICDQHGSQVIFFSLPLVYQDIPFHDDILYAFG